MKYLENPKLESLANALSVEGSECRLDFRIEAYSVKMVANDKRAWRDFLDNLGASPNDRQMLSPSVNENPSSFAGFSPGQLGMPLRNRHVSRCSSGGSDFEDNNEKSLVLCETINQKTLFYLISLLNASYSDYDFTDAKGEDFHRIHDFDGMKQKVESQISPLVKEAHIRAMWSRLEEDINPKECVIYSYNADNNTDPFSEDGCLWGLNYFFCNKRLRRILYLACQAFSNNVSSSDSAYGSENPLWVAD